MHIGCYWSHRCLIRYTVAKKLGGLNAIRLQMIQMLRLVLSLKLEDDSSVYSTQVTIPAGNHF